MSYANKTVNLPSLPDSKLPDNFLLDLQLVAVSELVGTVVSLTNITRRSDPNAVLSISFGTSPTDTITTFKIPLAVITNGTYPYYRRNPDGCLAVFGAGTSALYNACTNSTNLTLNIPVEPALCTQFNGAWLGVDNISTDPEKLGDLNGVNRTRPKLPLTDVSIKTLLTGDVQLLEGYNFRVDISNSLIDLEVGARYGLAMDCETSFLPPECLDCHELVSYINGVPPDAAGNFRLLAGSNIAITQGNTVHEEIDDQYTERANEHSLFVGLTFQGNDLCVPVTPTPPV